MPVYEKAPEGDDGAADDLCDYLWPAEAADHSEDEDSVGQDIDGHQDEMEGELLVSAGHRAMREGEEFLQDEARARADEECKPGCDEILDMEQVEKEDECPDVGQKSARAGNAIAEYDEQTGLVGEQIVHRLKVARPKPQDKYSFYAAFFEI